MTRLGLTDTRLSSQSFAIPAEIDPIPGAEIDLVFGDTFADALGVGEVALLHAVESRRYLGSGDSTEVVEPAAEGRMSGFVQEFANDGSMAQW